MVRIGTDIGGTFTDFVAIDEVSGSVHLGKTLTTPSDPSQGIFAGLDELAARISLSLRECTTLVHGTTLVINALIERKGTTTALVTTKGFRDVLEMRNEMRYDIYDLQIEYPKALVPRFLRLEIPERTSASGEILIKPDQQVFERLALRLSDAGVQSIAVCLLNSYANPENERLVGELLKRHLPKAVVSLSSDVLPQVKEYERTSTTVANAYVKPLVAQYLARIESGLANRDFDGEFYIMQSGGGVLSADVAQEFPIRILESGPAAGVAAARWCGEALGDENILCFDMGGTTAKLCAIARGNVLVTDEYEAARVYKHKRGSGIAINVPVFDLLEIGTGGGSIARINHLGLLKVGPESASASPGPACYGLGGVEPTVTDADVVLGYLDPSNFLGGGMRLHADRALAAIAERVAPHLAGMSQIEAAYGIHDLANEDMASAARLHLAERGESANSMCIVAYGGAGPLHAYGLARKLGVKRFVVPMGAGVMSAFGMLVEDVAIDRVQTHRQLLKAADAAEIDMIYRRLRTEAAGLLKVDEEHLKVERIADMRYRGQGYNVRVRLPNTLSDTDAMRLRFEDEYKLHYGRIYHDVEVELVNLRLVARRPSQQPFKRPTIEEATEDIASARKGTRRAWFGSELGYKECAVFDRYKLGAGHEGEGPALIEERETTTLIGPGGRFEANEFGMVIVHVA